MISVLPRAGGKRAESESWGVGRGWGGRGWLTLCMYRPVWGRKGVQCSHICCVHREEQERGVMGGLSLF